MTPADVEQVQKQNAMCLRAIARLKVQVDVLQRERDALRQERDELRTLAMERVAS